MTHRGHILERIGRATSASRSLVAFGLTVSIAFTLASFEQIAFAIETDARPIARKIETLRHNYVPMALAWSPDGKMLATASEVAGTVTLWDVQTAQVIRRFNREFMWGGSLAFGLEGAYLLTSVGGATDGGHPAAVTIWDVSTGGIVGQLPGPYPDKNLAFNAARLLAVDPNRKLLAVMAVQGAGRPIAIYDLKNRALTGTLSVDGDTPMALAVSPDAAFLAVGTIAGQIALFDTTSQKLLWKTDAAYGRFRAGVNALAYSPDGRFIASGPTKMLYGHESKIPGPASDAPTRIWSAASGSLTHSYPGSFQGVWSLDWSPNGKYLSSGNDDGVVQLWRIDGGDAPAIVTTFRGPAFAVAFSPDSGRLAAAGQNVVVISEIPNSD